jgi:hypothetical protein
VEGSLPSERAARFPSHGMNTTTGGHVYRLKKRGILVTNKMKLETVRHVKHFPEVRGS